MKTCSCGRRYTAREWVALPEIEGPPMVYEDDGGRWHRLELKNCECHSTMAVEFALPVEVRSEDDARLLCGDR